MIAPFLKHTGQSWKPVLGSIAVVIGLVATYTSLANLWGDISNERLMIIVGSATTVTVTALAGMIGGIRCPHCREKLFWRAIRGKEYPASLTWFGEFHTCPTCRYDPNRHEADAAAHRITLPRPSSDRQAPTGTRH